MKKFCFALFSFALCGLLSVGKEGQLDPDGTYPLRAGGEIPSDSAKIPFAERIVHSTVHRPGEEDPKFPHGAAIIEHKGMFYANWANSPINENGPHETLRGKRSLDGGKTW